MERIEDSTLRMSCLKRRQKPRTVSPLSALKVQNIRKLGDQNLEITFSKPDHTGWLEARVEKGVGRFRLEIYSYKSVSNPSREEVFLLKMHIDDPVNSSGFPLSLVEQVLRISWSREMPRKTIELDNDVARYKRQERRKKQLKALISFNTEEIQTWKEEKNQEDLEKPRERWINRRIDKLRQEIKEADQELEEVKA